MACSPSDRRAGLRWSQQVGLVERVTFDKGYAGCVNRPRSLLTPGAFPCRRESSETIAMIGYVRALAGETARARAVLAELKSIARRRYIPPVNIAVIHLDLRERDKAFAWLEKAWHDRDVRLSFSRWIPKGIRSGLTPASPGC